MNTAKNISKLFFKNAKGIGSFVSSKAYGVLNADGMALSKDGVTPSTYVSMAVAKEIALYADDFKGHCWINVFSSIEEAKAN